MFKSNYFDDKKESKSLKYEDNGTLISTRIYNNCVMISENGQILATTELQNSALEKDKIESYIDSAYYANH